MGLSWFKLSYFVFQKWNISNNVAGIGVPCTLSKFFNLHLKTNFLWLIKFLIICMYWNTSTGQKSRWSTLEFLPDYRTVSLVSTRLAILVWEDGVYKGQHSVSWEWPRPRDEDWHWSNFLFLFYAIRPLLSIKLPLRREKKNPLVFLKYWYVLYIFLYAFRVGKDRVIRKNNIFVWVDLYITQPANLHPFPVISFTLL